MLVRAFCEDCGFRSELFIRGQGTFGRAYNYRGWRGQEPALCTNCGNFEAIDRTAHQYQIRCRCGNRLEIHLEFSRDIINEGLKVTCPDCDLVLKVHPESVKTANCRNCGSGLTFYSDDISLWNDGREYLEKGERLMNALVICPKCRKFSLKFA